MEGNVFSDWLQQYFDEVTPREFYRTIFPDGELDLKDAYSKGKYVGIIVQVSSRQSSDGRPRVYRYTVTDDLDVIDHVCSSDDFCLMSPISYAGKQRTAEHARFLYALAVDLDKVIIRDGLPRGLIDLWNGHIVRAERVPKPTYIVSSGTGLHLYYVFEKAIPLFPDLAKKLQKLKRELTIKLWNEGVVDIKDQREIQQEGIYQGFRMPGTVTKNGNRVRVFETGEKVDLEYLNQFVSRDSKVNLYAVKSDLPLKIAAEKYPEWYERRIVNKEPKGVWHVSRRLYDWWKRQILDGARVGHRYYCLMTLAIYAQKCSMYDEKHNPDPVTREELEKDCFEIMEYFETLTDSEDNHFGEDDVLDALEAYDQKWISYPRSSISYRSGIDIPKNERRNYQKQEWHLEDIRAKKERMKRRGQEFKNPEGRPNKKKLVQEFKIKNPEMSIRKAAETLQISPTTVLKYWNMNGVEENGKI